MLYAFVQQHHTHQLLLASVVPDLHEDEDNTIFLLCLLNYHSKTCMVRIVFIVFTMTIFPEQKVPRPLPCSVNRTFASLDPSWCYRYTSFTNDQLQLLYELLIPPPRFNIRNGKCHCSSEEAFIIMMVKLATGVPTLDSKVFLENGMIR
jgi:hypothetical protein